MNNIRPVPPKPTKDVKKKRVFISISPSSERSLSPERHLSKPITLFGQPRQSSRLSSFSSSSAFSLDIEIDSLSEHVESKAMELKQDHYTSSHKNEQISRGLTYKNQVWTLWRQGSMNYVFKAKSGDSVIKVTKKAWLNPHKNECDAREEFLNKKMKFIIRLEKAGFNVNKGQVIQGNHWVEPLVSDEMCDQCMSYTQSGTNEHFSINDPKLGNLNAVVNTNQTSIVETEVKSKLVKETIQRHNEIGFSLLDLFFKKSDEFVIREDQMLVIQIPDIKPDNVSMNGILIDLDPIPVRDKIMSHVDVNLNTLIMSWRFDEEQRATLTERKVQFIDGIKRRYHITD